MSKLGPKSLLCCTLLGIVACTLPRAHVDQDGPEVVLSAADRVAEFDVKLCINGPKIRNVDGAAYVSAEIEAPDGALTGVLRGQLDGTDDEFQQDELTLATLGEHGDFLSFDLVGEGPWEGRKGRRCSEPQRVRFELAGGDEAAELRFGWVVGFTTIYSDSLVRPDDIADEDLSVEIEPVE